MSESAVYEETILAKGIALILSVTALMMLAFMVLQATTEVLDAGEDTRFMVYFWLFMAVLMGAMAFNFRQLTLHLAPSGIVIGFGLPKHRIDPQNIEKAELDAGSALKYGGAGIRLTRVKGKWRLGYILMKGPRIVLTLKEGKIREFAFSTSEPEKVLEWLREWSGAKGRGIEDEC